MTPELEQALSDSPLYSQDDKQKDAVCHAIFSIGNVRWYVLEGEKEALVIDSGMTVKNVRSVLDSYTFQGKWKHDLFAGCALYTYEESTYHVPAVVIENDWYIDETENMLLDENGILLIVEG